LSKEFIKLNIYGDIKVIKSIEHASRMLMPGLQDGMLKLMYDVRTDSQSEYLSGPRPEKLGVVTGTLRSTLRVRSDIDRDRIIGTIGTGVEAFYGIFHELGTKIHPSRPFLRPAMEDNISNAKSIFRNVVDRIARSV
jgi:HK97 gp10 family phage protein